MAHSTSTRLSTALEYIKNTPGLPGARSFTQDGKATVAVSNGGLEGRVYRPTTEEQAQRNLNFAIANLTAYVDWDQRGRAEQIRAELEAKRKAELAEAEARLKEVRLKNGLDLYNKVHNTRHLTWAGPIFVPAAQREAWAKQAEELAKLQRASNPFSFGGISPAVLRASDLYPTSFRL